MAYVVIARWSARAGEEARARALLVELTKRTRAEPGCRLFQPTVDRDDPRELLGDRALIAPELACVLDTDPTRAREKARAYAKLYLRLRNYTNNLLRFGFAEGDILDGGSDRLIDAVVPQGTAREIAAVVRAHLDAGADHVCVQPVGVEGVPEEEWSELAAAVIG